MKVKEESETVGLKLNIQKTKIMASGPITSWQIDGETVETVASFIFLGSKITAGGDCSHEIKRRLLLGRKVMTNLDSILQSRDITLSTKICPVKAMVFPIVMYGCESWTAKKAECRRIDAFGLWCWIRLLWVTWTARRSSQSILKEISPGCSLEGLMLKLKFQYFGHLMWRADSLEKTLMLGKIEGRRRRGWQSMRRLDGITDSVDMGLGRLRQLVIDRDARTWLSNWTERNKGHIFFPRQVAGLKSYHFPNFPAPLSEFTLGPLIGFILWLSHQVQCLFAPRTPSLLPGQLRKPGLKQSSSICGQ